MPEGQEGHSIFFRVHVVLWWLIRFGLQGAAEVLVEEVSLVMVAVGGCWWLIVALFAISVAVVVAAALIEVACTRPTITTLR